MSETEKPIVTSAQRESLQQDGAILLHDLFDQQWLTAIAAGIEKNLADPGPYAESLDSGSGRFFNDYCNWQTIPEYRDYVWHSPAAEIAARLMGSRTAVFYHEHLLIKEPGNQSKTPWHQDQPYYPVDGRHVCSIWMPLDPVPLESSLQFVKGSHAWNRWFIPRKFATQKNYAMKYGDDQLATSITRYETVPNDIDSRPDKYEILSWPIDPGDCIVFFGLTLHGAAGNVSLTTSRRAFSTRWFGDDARFSERPWQISPPFTGGLTSGESMACDLFPLVWSQF